MTIRTDIEARLNVQESIEGKTENITRLRKFLACIKSQSQWQAFVDVAHHRYGKMSYQCHHFYYATDELIEIMS